MCLAINAAGCLGAAQIIKSVCGWCKFGCCGFFFFGFFFLLGVMVFSE